METLNIFTAASDGDSIQVRRFISEGISIDAQDSNGYTPLQAATSYNHTELTLELLTSGASINLTDHEGDTCLHLVTTPEVLQILLDHGADVTVRNKEGRLPIETAWIEARDEVVAVLEGLTDAGWVKYEEERDDENGGDLEYVLTADERQQLSDIMNGDTNLVNAHLDLEQ